jgi:tRNA-splicing ligase RtcB (3'-phosphate/5'-hydroxy nucleic acid ligase)
VQLVDEKIAVFGQAEEGALSQIRTCAKTAAKVALMPDNHKGYGVPIGGVVAYKDAISPTGVGYDIGCGNKAVRLDMPGAELRKNIKAFMDAVWDNISFGIGQKNDTKVDHELFDKLAWKLPGVAPLKELARGQLGTVGSGNHFVDLFTDEQDRVWVGVHFGSRGLGHKIATYFLNQAGAKDGMDVEPVVLDTHSDLGVEYLIAMDLAGQYAYAGRDWVCDHVTKLLGATALESVHNHHNLAWLEEHGGEMLWVVRKGATPAFPGQKGFIGGSMGEQSVIIEGVENDLAKHSLYSTVHGAGRAMGRKEATGVVKFNKETGERRVVREGKVTPEMMKVWLDRSGIELRGGGLDESPDCYKRLSNVLDATEGTIKILHTLTPVGVAMAGAREFDPYKD